MTNLVQTLEIPKKMKWEIQLEEIPEGFDVTIWNDENDHQFLVEHSDFAKWLKINGYFEWTNDHFNPFEGHTQTSGTFTYNDWLYVTDDIESVIMNYLTSKNKI